MDPGDSEKKRFLPEVKEDAPVNKIKPDIVGLNTSSTPYRAYDTVNNFLKNIHKPVENGVLIINSKPSDMLTKVKPTKKLVVKKLYVKTSMEHLPEFLDLVDADHLKFIHVNAEEHNTEIFDLPLVRKTNHVATDGILCPDDKLLQIDAEKFSNYPLSSQSDNNDRNQQTHSVLGAVQSVWKWMKGPQPKKFNSPIAVNQYIKKCLLHLDTKNHEFWLWPHDKYDIQTILLGLEVISSRTYQNGTVHMVDSIHPEFVFAVLLSEFGVFGRRMARGSEMPTLLTDSSTPLEP